MSLVLPILLLLIGLTWVAHGTTEMYWGHSQRNKSIALSYQIGGLTAIVLGLLLIWIKFLSHP